MSEETYDGVDLIVTRKGAISTADGRKGIIPGSMGTGSFIVSGLSNPDSYCSVSHGAARRMSRAKARKQFSVADLAAQTEGVECRKDAGVIDETRAPARTWRRSCPGRPTWCGWTTACERSCA